MYFNEKGNTNIDNQFKGTKKLDINLSLENPKNLLFIGGGILLLIVIIAIIVILVVNGNKPKIELLGEDTMTINVGSEYFDPGYKAYDKNGNDITNEVDVISNIDTSKEGNYEVTYKVRNNKAIRYITVVKGLDETYIKLKGNVNMNLQVGEEYIDPGYQVYDSIDKDLNEKVKVFGTVDTSKAGTYQITYSVVNSRNVTTSVKRTIIVRDINNSK